MDYMTLKEAKADWLIGINATRLFSILYHKTLNVGRVQTPTLAMLVNRDYAISSFKKEKYHVVRLDVGGVAALSERQDDEAAARQMKAACEKSQAVCTSLKKRKRPQPRRNCLTSPPCSGKQTVCMGLRRNRPLTMRKPFMKNGF